MKKILGFINFILLIILCSLLFKTFSNHFFNMKYVEVPNVVGLNKEDALRVLNSVKLDAMYISSKSYDVPIDYIFAQKPEAKQIVKQNRAITLYVNDNKNTVPKIIGLSLAEAQNILKENGIEIERIDYIPSTDSENKVVSVYPNEKSRLEYGAKLSLLVSTQKLENYGRMPNIVGLDINDAIEILQSRNIVVKEIKFLKDPMTAQNVILSTKPKPDEILKTNEVSIVVNEPQVKTTQDEIEKIIRQSVGE